MNFMPIIILFTVLLIQLVSNCKFNSSDTKKNTFTPYILKSPERFGKEMPIEIANYHVSLIKDGEHFCEGSIISENYVITNNLCYTAEEVRAGSKYANSGGSIHRVLHAVYFRNPHSREDIAILKVFPSFIFDATRGPITLSHLEIKPSSNVIVTWYHQYEKGDCFSNYLTGKDMIIVDKTKCSLQLDKEIAQTFICGGNSTHFDNVTCPKIVGAPVVFNNKLVGVAMSHIMCYEKDDNDFYANIAYYEDVIMEHVRNDEFNSFEQTNFFD